MAPFLRNFTEEQAEDLRAEMLHFLRPLRIRFYTVLIACILGIAGGIYLHDRDQAEIIRHNCLAINDARTATNKRSEAIVSFLQTQLRLGHLERKIRPIEPQFRKLEVQQQQAIIRLITEEKDLPLLHCPGG